ncbi:hypothetical protein DRP05_14640 [Archaeoglobales archaeon]|nr:MAG: hypothetical protein DRP05_14640 [Archaeoglobales archaeon]
MDKSFICKLAVVMGIGAVVGFATYSGNALLVIIAVFIGILLLRLCKSKTVIEDERVYFVSEKASRMALQIFVIGIAITGAGLIASKNELKDVGYILSYLTCILLVLYLISYGYYSKKYG